MTNGTYTIVTGLSGAGKSTLVDALLKLFPSSTRLVTTTTRSPRQGEVDGRDFHYLSRPEFERRIEAGDFLEWDDHYGNLYGSSRVEVDKLLARHPIVYGVVDVNGAMATKKLMPSCVTVFIDVDDLSVIRRRVENRKGITAEDLAMRMKAAAHERSFATMCDHVIVNHEGRLSETITKAADIVRSLMLGNVR